ncbi:RidA family protein [Pseudomonas sp. NPDC087342]|uniref:RidA family protein n=1 Tax=Pseudomonas sp. NPDC087342 TaxID=3364437 RepID=UPI00381744D8
MSIIRKQIGERMSQAAIYNRVVYLAGQVGNPEGSISEQTGEALSRIDSLLSESGSSRNSILSATIFLADISDFKLMNDVWDEWIRPGFTPARACAEAKLAHPYLKVEIIVIAAVE